jgi:integrase/recombinase XerD
MKAATFRVIFNRKKKKLKAGEKSLVQVEVYFGGVRKYYSTGVYLQNDEWNKSGNRVIKRVDAVSLNEYLNNILNDYESYQFNRFKHGLVFSHEAFDVYVKSGASKQSFLDFMQTEIDSRDDITQDTKDSHNVILKRIKSAGIITFNDITYENILKYDSHLRKKEYADETISTSHAQFKSYIHRAIKKGLIEKSPYELFQIQEPNRTNRRFLTATELAKIEEKTFDIPRIEKVKDMFLFSCYTGLAFGDGYMLSPDHIVEEEGNLWIRKKRKKRENRLSILILPKAREILEKYKNQVKPGKILPYLSNQKMNSYLKEIGDLCGISIELTTHVARHTFATTVLLTNKVPIETVSKLLGHTNLKTTQIYAKIVDSKIKKDMDDLKRLL